MFLHHNCCQELTGCKAIVNCPGAIGFNGAVLSVFKGVKLLISGALWLLSFFDEEEDADGRKT